MTSVLDTLASLCSGLLPCGHRSGEHLISFSLTIVTTIRDCKIEVAIVRLVERAERPYVIDVLGSFVRVTLALGTVERTLSLKPTKHGVT